MKDTQIASSQKRLRLDQERVNTVGIDADGDEKCNGSQDQSPDMCFLLLV